MTPEESTSRHAKCWASPMGNCSTVLSREHIISKSLFGEDVTVLGTRGLPMPPETPIGISSLTARVLCEKHNNDLSALDDEIHKLGDALANLETSQGETVELDGLLVERWMLKVIAGSMASGWLPWIRAMPSDMLVRRAFGKERMPANWSLFGAAPIEWMPLSKRHVGVRFFKGNGPTEVGVLFLINGMALLYSININDPTATLRSIDHQQPGLDFSKASARRHPKQFVASAFYSPSNLVQITFKWPKRWPR